MLQYASEPCPVWMPFACCEAGRCFRSIVILQWRGTICSHMARRSGSTKSSMQRLSTQSTNCMVCGPGSGDSSRYCRQASGYYRQTGKLYVVLWKLYLMVGLSYERIRVFCNSVRSITIDMGFERFISRFFAVLPDFCQALGILCPDKDERQKVLFLSALDTPDWNHGLDMALRRCCCSHVWFPLLLGEAQGSHQTHQG